jgi:hypothetical protein
VLEIFDQLVKNQAPDSTRTLYTYLNTRPNTAKRLDSLIEDAFAGKGLDAVCHYFHSPVHDDVGVDAEDPAVDPPEQSDNYDSFAGTEVDGDGNVDSGEGSAYHAPTEGTPEDEESAAPMEEATMMMEDYDQFEAEDEDAMPYEADLNIADADAHEPFGSADDLSAPMESEVRTEALALDLIGEEHVQTDIYNGKLTIPPSPCFKPEFCFCASCVSEFEERHKHEEEEFRQGVALRAEARRRLSQEPEPEHALGAESIGIFQSATERTDSLSYLHDTSTVESLADYRRKENEADPSDSMPAHDADTFDHNNIQPGDSTAGQDTDQGSKVTPNTSATATLDGEDEIDYDNDLDVHVGLSRGAAQNLESTVADEPQDDENPSTLSERLGEQASTGKRPRSEEEDGTGDEELQGKSRYSIRLGVERGLTFVGAKRRRS